MHFHRDDVMTRPENTGLNHKNMAQITIHTLNGLGECIKPVSYTHLTLPTIYSV